MTKTITLRFVLLLFLLGISASSYRVANAEGPERQTTIIVSVTEYEWWLTRWSDNQILCRITSEHEGMPTSDEVIRFCGGDIQSQWLNTPPCLNVLSVANDTSSCSGLYLHLIASQPKDKEIQVELPPAKVWVSLDGCTPDPGTNLCNQIPSLLLTAEEPLPNEQILNVQGTINQQPFYCESPTCILPLTTTPEDGISVEFWADSSYGDSSEVYTAQVRVIDSGVSLTPGGGGWFVDVLSTQWRGARLASCAQTWQAFPPVGGPKAWLSSPEHSELLASDEAYFYLAGRLIAQGAVDASACPTGGLLPNGYADACGLETARDAVESWQNQFDERIFEVAQSTGVPAQLMKNLFAQESQFWPGVFRVPYEFGLGQLTDNGADTILLWDADFYNQFCPLVLNTDACNQGYLHLPAEDQAILRGALASEAKSDCEDCPDGVDLTNADFSVMLFADTLKASCDQVAQIVFNATGNTPGVVSSYIDLWRFTVANYHAGPGCLSYAIHTAWANNRVDLPWDEVADRFTEPCKSAVPYVEAITQ